MSIADIKRSNIGPNRKWDRFKGSQNIKECWQSITTRKGVEIDGKRTPKEVSGITVYNTFQWRVASARDTPEVPGGAGGLCGPLGPSGGASWGTRLCLEGLLDGGWPTGSLGTPGKGPPHYMVLNASFQSGSCGVVSRSCPGGGVGWRLGKVG